MPVEQGHLLLELKKGSAKAFESLYKDHYRMVATLISRMGGSPYDAEDIFQESLFVLVKNIRQPDFKLTAKISTYLHAIARNQWLKKSKKQQHEISTHKEDIFSVRFDFEDNIKQMEEKELMIGVVMDRLNGMEEVCKKVIRLTFLKKLSHAEVAELLGYTVAFVKVKKFRCLKYLRGMVADSPFFKNG